MNILIGFQYEMNCGGAVVALPRIGRRKYDYE